MFAKILALVVVLINLEFYNVQAVFGVRKHNILKDVPKGVSLVGKRVTTNNYFEQKVDHLNTSDSRVWKQRYHISEEYFNETSKNNVFLLLGGESEAAESWLEYGAWIDTAKQYGALLVYLEHRYYGASQLFEDLSTENLQYLSVSQALSDTANFIEAINENYNISQTDAKWIVFGGSYAGTLAAWLRQEYPHLVAGAVASSAPLEAVLDFHDYLQVVRNGVANYSQSCADNIKEAFLLLEEIAETCYEGDDAFEELNDAFQLCDDVGGIDITVKDLATLSQYLADENFAYTVQYHGLSGISIDRVCEIMINETGGSSVLQRLGQVNSLTLSASAQTCTDFKYNNLVKTWQNTTIKSSSMMRQWVYQTCTEFGFFQTSSQEDPTFGTLFNITYFTDLCMDVFGVEFNETLITSGIETINNRFGGKSINMSNIVYFHGSLDPWHVVGKLEASEDAEHKVVVVEGVSHCANMMAPADSDSEEMTAARTEIDRLIGEWLTPISSNPENSSSPALFASIYILIGAVGTLYASC